MNLSDHFTLSEFLQSETAEREGIDNYHPPGLAIENMELLCSSILEPMRANLGAVRILSGWRCLALNRAVKSKDDSQHVLGQAADVWVPGKTHAEVFNYIQAHLLFDQLIREFPPNGWVHVSYVPVRPRADCRLAVVEVQPDGKVKTAYPLQVGPVSA